MIESIDSLDEDLWYFFRHDAINLINSLSVDFYDLEDLLQNQRKPELFSQLRQLQKTFQHLQTTLRKISVNSFQNAISSGLMHDIARVLNEVSIRMHSMGKQMDTSPSRVRAAWNNIITSTEMLFDCMNFFGRITIDETEFSLAEMIGEVLKRINHGRIKVICNDDNLDCVLVGNRDALKLAVFHYLRTIATNYHFENPRILVKQEGKYITLNIINDTGRKTAHEMMQAIGNYLSDIKLDKIVDSVGGSVSLYSNTSMAGIKIHFKAKNEKEKAYLDRR